MKMGKLEAFVFVGVAIGAAVFLFGSDRGKQVRQQLAVSAAELPEAVKDFAALVDADEIIGILADNALSELKPTIGDLFKIGKH